MTVPILATIMSAFTGFTIAAFFFYIKRSAAEKRKSDDELAKRESEERNRLYAEMAKHTATLDNMNRILNDIKIELPQNYVTKKELEKWQDLDRDTHDKIYRRIDGHIDGAPEKTSTN